MRAERLRDGRCVVEGFLRRIAIGQHHRAHAVSAQGVTPTLELTPAQRSAIYQEVHRDTSKVAPSRFATHIGADVPPTIDLYPLPDDIQANSPEIKFYKFTGVDDEVVLVDPTKMRVIAVIGPKPKQR